LSEKTVRNYLSNIFDKLQVTRRAQAAALFVRQQSNA
jgi:DNA-binding NarL/FixJ family response regulator